MPPLLWNNLPADSDGPFKSKLQAHIFTLTYSLVSSRTCYHYWPSRSVSVSMNLLSRVLLVHVCPADEENSANFLKISASLHSLSLLFLLFSLRLLCAGPSAVLWPLSPLSVPHSRCFVLSSSVCMLSFLLSVWMVSFSFSLLCVCVVCPRRRVWWHLTWLDQGHGNCLCLIGWQVSIKIVPAANYSKDACDSCCDAINSQWWSKALWVKLTPKKPKKVDDHLKTACVVFSAVSSCVHMQ